MSARTKKHLTESEIRKQLLYVVDKGQLYAIPKKVAKKYAVETKKAVARSGNVSAEELFADLDKKHTKAKRWRSRTHTQKHTSILCAHKQYNARTKKHSSFFKFLF